ncbi:hypothetical protein [Winogradskyella luteola]|uniref:DUF4852 domain-containing protein n=1 Tax=Winogradskyella luteola TaxID=2828330 RepID=A0A9X1FB87_9FLAO|nr:hypothetical protein [Winogradskyella luteola]MBV7270660.1 hypothetical protein [Winogradskyella luteola]
MKHFLVIALIFISSLCHSQIKIGQQSSETLYFLTHLVNNRSDWQMEKRFYNGEIKELVVYKTNQLYYDLNINLDVVESYVMIDGYYSYNIVQFPSLKTDYLQQIFDDKYHNNKIENLYFTNDYLHYRTIELIDGNASVIYKKFNANSFSDRVINEVEKRKLQYLIDTDNRESVSDKRKSLLFDYFNVEDYDSSFVNRIKPKIINSVIEQAKNDLRDFIDKKSSRSFDVLKTSYQVRFYAKSNSKISKCKVKSLDSSILYRPAYIYDIMFKLPFIQKQYNGRTYQLNRELMMKLDYDLTFGSVDVKHRNNRPFEILSNKNLSPEIKQRITEQLKNYKSGKYTLYYQFGTINGINASELLVYDLKK